MPKAPTQDWSQRSRDLAHLLSRTALGDRQAFAQLYAQSSPHLFAVVLRIQRDRAQAEDVLQEVYVNVWRAAQAFDAAQSQPLTWLTSIARHRAIDSLRRRQVDPMSAAAAGPDDEEQNVYDDVADPGAGPLALLDQASDVRELERCMAQLGGPQRQSVALAFYDGLSHAEVAERMRQPLGTVKSWVRRALQALKSCLDRAVERDAQAEAR